MPKKDSGVTKEKTSKIVKKISASECGTVYNEVGQAVPDQPKSRKEEAYAMAYCGWRI